jgi:hypothetical protein
MLRHCVVTHACRFGFPGPAHLTRTEMKIYVLLGINHKKEFLSARSGKVIVTIMLGRQYLQLNEDRISG